MVEKGKAPAIILIVLIIISLALAGGGFYLLQKEKTKNLELQDKLEELATKQKITENKLDESKKKIVDMEVKLSDAKSQIDTLNNDLQQEKTARQEAQSKIDQMAVDLEQQKNLRSDLEKRLGEAQNDVRKVQSQLKELDAQRADLEAKINDLKKQAQGVELGNIVVSPAEGGSVATAALTPSPKANRGIFGFGKKKEAPVSQKSVPVAAAQVQAPASPSSLEGKVLVINKEYNFAVINLGSKDGVEVGSEFSLYHNDKYLGDVKVEKVHDSMAAAGFVSQDIKEKVAEGDKVVQKVK